MKALKFSYKFLLYTATSITLFFIYFSFNSSIYSESANQGSINWERIYDGPNHFLDTGYDICEADSGNYYLVGSTHFGGAGGARIWVVKINAFGDTLWTKVLNNKDHLAFACAPSPKDGGCVLTGDGSSPYMIKLDKNGNIVWSNIYPGFFTQTFSMINTSDGGYAACGRTSFDSAIVLKVNSMGQLEWMKLFGSNYYKHFEDLKEITNGFVLIGNVRESAQGTRVPMMIKISNSANLIWEKRYEQLYKNSAKSVNNLDESQYLFAGTVLDTVSNSYQGYMVRTDSSGNILFTKKFLTNQTDEYLNEIKISKTGAHVITLDQISNGGADLFAKVIISNSLGSILYEKVFSSHLYTTFNTVQPLLNGDLIFMGSMKRFGDLHRDFYAVRTDSILNYTPISVSSIITEVPTGFELYQNYPNPFNPTTIIKIDIPERSEVKLIVYDILGRQVAVLVNEKLNAGSYNVNFDGSKLNSGVYFYKLETENFTQTKKMLLVK